MTGYAPRRIAADLSRRRGRLSPTLGTSRPDDGRPDDGPPVVGVGASAGGLDAFRKFFTGFPAGSGMAFVLIQHLDPTHESMMVELLAGHTAMTVVQAADDMRVEPDHIYLIPPGSYLSIEAGALHLSKPLERHGARMPIDFFLRSLAAEYGERAICAILSGTGTDGSLGVRAIKEKGGLVIAQDPEEAAFDGMPRSAILTGSVDLVLPIAKMSEVLIRYSRQTYLKAGDREPSSDAAADGLARIIDLLSAGTAQDFTLYKPGTLQRRTERRMAMAAIKDSAGYLEILRKNPQELEALAKDLLINVTQFFRDPAAFALLAETVVPDLVRRQTLDQPLRIWVPGCSTGEEAYSIAMLFLEEIAAAKRNIKLQVFASDIDPGSVAFARQGIYPESIEADVPPARLVRFFVKEDHSYRVVRELRETVVFTVQNLLSDAPFSRLDLVSCRNLLIYLRPEVQEKILALFHFALRPGGILFLGSSETVGNLTDRFKPIGRKQRIYRHIGRSRLGEVEFPINGGGSGRTLWPRAAAQMPARRPSLGDLSQRLLLEAYAPASVLINLRYEGLHYFGAMDRYLKVAAGDASRDVLTMAREGLRPKLRAAIQRATQEQTPVLVTGAQVKRDGVVEAVSIRAQPVQSDGETLLLISFIDEPESERKPPPARTAEPAAAASRIAQLEQELDATRRDLESAIRDLEIANEEQKAINEEAMSVNEEFQSTNEELETSKEELQSLNEELTALNNQLQETIEQQRSTANDLQNILNSSDVATLFLDGDLNIRFFTPAVRSLFNVIAADVGRPLGDLTRRFHDKNLLSDARAVLATLTPIRREVETDDGAWHIRGILPYRTEDRRIEGVVITFADISEIKAAGRALQAARAYSDSIIDTIRQPLVVLDEDLRVVSGSRAFYHVFATTPEKTVGRRLPAVSTHLDVPALRDFLDRTQAEGGAIESDEIEIDLPELGRRTLLLDAREVREEASAQRKILVAIEDVTERKRQGEALEAAKQQAVRANIGKSRFLAATSHDLRQPLQTIYLVQGLLASRVKDDAALKLVRTLEETVSAMSGMLDTLLDINQLESGTVRPEIIEFPINDLFGKLKTEFAYHAAAHGVEWRVIASSLSVRSDPRLLEQILRNLLSNAVKSTNRGKILLGCRRRPGTLRIEVWDTGVGIPEGQLQAIFEEFHQLDNSAGGKNRGFGLGLSIVQRLGGLLGHAIDVRSWVGSGSVFAVELPIAGRRREAPLLHNHSEAGENARSVGRILVVDGDLAVREMLQTLLEGVGHRTASAADGRKALDLAADETIRPDLLIAGYKLPNGFNGLQVVGALREALHRPIPAIILTGDISTDTARDITRKGFVHLNKPVKAAELLGLTQTLLAEQRPAASSNIRPPAETGNGTLSPTIFVVDDDSRVRELIREGLEAAGKPVADYASCEAFLEVYRPGREGCLVVDAHMPGMGGLELLRRLKGTSDQLPAIMITGSGDVGIAVQAMKAGAVDFIEKPVGRAELLASIERALEHTRDSAKLSAWREIAASRIARLTARQRQVMELVLAGHPSKNIAADLGISQRTVENHRAAVMKMTGSKSLPALIRLALAVQ